MPIFPRFFNFIRSAIIKMMPSGIYEVVLLLHRLWSGIGGDADNHAEYANDSHSQYPGLLISELTN
jgi:hypothetical protein